MSKKFIGFINITKRGRFKPLCAQPIYMPGDNDYYLNVLASMEVKATLEEAQDALLKAKDEDITLFLNPVEQSCIGDWMSALQEANKDVVWKP